MAKSATLLFVTIPQVRNNDNYDGNINSYSDMLIIIIIMIINHDNYKGDNNDNNIFTQG